MNRRIVIPRAEADSYAAQSSENLLHPAYCRDPVNKGLFIWWPDPWSSVVDDALGPYFFWVYDVCEDITSDGPLWGPEGESWVLLVGTSPKGGDSLCIDKDVEVESWPHERRSESLRNLQPATTDQLSKAGLSDVEILSLAMN
jgi:hypothetical protein